MGYYQLADLPGEVARCASRWYRLLYQEPDAMNPRLPIRFHLLAEDPIPEDLLERSVDLLALDDAEESAWARRSLRSRGCVVYYFQDVGEMLYVDPLAGRWATDKALTRTWVS